MIERDNVDRGVEIALRAGERGGGVSGSKTRGGGHERVNYSERVWMYMSCDAMLSRRGLYEDLPDLLLDLGISYCLEEL
jgi:hypothetical protein